MISHRKYKTTMNSTNSFNQSIPPRSKILIAAIAWTLVAVALFLRSGILLFNFHHYLLEKVLASITLGILFYLLLFFKISFRRSRLIISLTDDNPRSLSFFDVKRDILITIIAITGFLLRGSGIISFEYVSILYIATGIPLLLSTLRFYYYGTFYDEINHLK